MIIYMDRFIAAVGPQTSDMAADFIFVSALAYFKFCRDKSESFYNVVETSRTTTRQIWRFPDLPTVVERRLASTHLNYQANVQKLLMNFLGKIDYRLYISEQDWKYYSPLLDLNMEPVKMAKNKQVQEEGEIEIVVVRSRNDSVV